jgi:hypothetical protein
MGIMTTLKKTYPRKATPPQQGVRATTRPWQRQRALDIPWYTRG